MQPLDPTLKSTWLAPTQTAITKNNANLLQGRLADDATLAEQLTTWQQEINSDPQPTVQEPLKKAFALWMKDAGIPTSIQTVLAKDPTAKVPSYITGYLALDPKDPASVEAYKAQLTKEFGGLKNSKGKSLINTDLIDAVASGDADFNDLGNQITNAVQAAANKTLGSSASQFSDITDSPTYKNLLSDPSKLADAYNANVSKLKQNATTGLWEVGTSGASGSDSTGASGTKEDYKYTGGINQLLNAEGTVDPTKMANMVGSYDTQKGAWRMPTIDPTTGKFGSNTSPYGQVLTNSLNNYLTKGDYYSPDYVNSLASKQPAAMSSEGIAALKGTFTDPLTSRDVLNLNRSIGTNYDVANAVGDATFGSTLSPTLLKAYQPSTTTNKTTGKTSTEAKPGVPDPTTTTVPGAITSGGAPALTSTTLGVLNPVTITSKADADKLHKIEQDKIAAEAKRIADERIKKELEDKLTREKDAAEKLKLQEELNTLKAAEAKRIADAAEAKRIADAAEAKRIADEKAAAEKTLLSTYAFNRYITPETRAALATNPDFYKSALSAAPDLVNRIEYSNLVDARAGNTGATTTAASIQNASNVANQYNPIPALGTAPAQASANANNGIATNTGGFTSTSNMNTNATGPNGAAGITSVLPQSTGTPNYATGLTLNTSPISGVDPNQVSLTAQQQPVNNTPNYATGLTLNTSPSNAGAPNTNQASLTTAPQFTQANYVNPETRNSAFFQNIAANDPTAAAAAAWSAQQDAAKK